LQAKELRDGAHRQNPYANIRHARGRGAAVLPNDRRRSRPLARYRPIPAPRSRVIRVHPSDSENTNGAPAIDHNGIARAHPHNQTIRHTRSWGADRAEDT
jgi:hypothetical protein